MKVKVKDSKSTSKKGKALVANEDVDSAGTRSFYSLPDFENWLMSLQNNNTGNANMHKYQIKYYKGLGTSTAIEGQVH